MKIKVIDKSNNALPEYATIGSAGMDLKASLKESIVLKPFERKLIPIDLYIQLPDGYEAQIRPRSGLAFKNGITVLNSPGTIDCVTGGTNIKTLDSEITAKELFNINEKKIILSFNEEDFCLEEDIVSDMWIVENLELLEIKTNNNSIIIPKEKPVYTKRGWVKAECLNLDDEVLEI